MDAKAVERAKARIVRMKQEAEELTKALGLPPEATYTVMAAMHEAKASLAAQEVQPGTRASADARLELVYQLTEGFLKTHMKEQVNGLPGLWDKLKIFSLETLGEEPNQPSTALAGLRFMGSNPIVPVISIISWWVVKGTFLSKVNPPDQLESIIARRAGERGCSRVLSYALAEYLVRRNQ